MSENLDRIFMDVYKDIEKGLEKGKETLAKEIEEDIKEGTPVCTGALRDGYSISIEGGNLILTTEEDYWKHVEFGTSEREARPHIRPVLRDTKMMKRCFVQELDSGGKVY